MRTTPFRDLLLGALLLVASWVPAAMIAAPGTAEQTAREVPVVETPATQVSSERAADAPDMTAEQRS